MDNVGETYSKIIEVFMAPVGRIFFYVCKR